MRNVRRGIVSAKLATVSHSDPRYVVQGCDSVVAASRLCSTPPLSLAPSNFPLAPANSHSPFIAGFMMVLFVLTLSLGLLVSLVVGLSLSLVTVRATKAVQDAVSVTVLLLSWNLISDPNVLVDGNAVLADVACLQAEYKSTAADDRDRAIYLQGQHANAEVGYDSD